MIFRQIPMLLFQKCYGLLDETALEVSGILKITAAAGTRTEKGQGVMIGFIDTGIDYRKSGISVF